MVDAISSSPILPATTLTTPAAAPPNEQELTSHFDDVLAGLLKICSDAETAIGKVGEQLQALSNQEPFTPSTTEPSNTLLQAQETATPTTQTASVVQDAVGAGTLKINDVSDSQPSGPVTSTDASSVVDKKEDTSEQFLVAVKASQSYYASRQVTEMAESLFATNA